MISRAFSWTRTTQRPSLEKTSINTEPGAKLTIWKIGWVIRIVNDNEEGERPSPGMKDLL